MLRHHPNFYINLIGLLLVALVAGSFAQITITSNEYPITFGEEVNIVEVTAQTGAGIPVNVGNTGGPQNWVFTETLYPGGEPFYHKVIDPAGTPFSNSFPGANHAWYAFEVDTTTGDTSEIYLYYNRATSSLFWLGNGAQGMGFSSVSVNTPPEVLFPFPATVGSSWSNNFSSTNDIGGGVIFFDTTSNQLTIDAWGDITAPLGTFPCLRIREDAEEISETYFGGVLFSSDTIRFIAYSWVTENIGLLANVESRKGETNPNFTAADNVNFRTNSPTAIGDKKSPLTSKFSLAQNYPNPFNPETTIRFAIAKSGFTTLSVYNVTGQEVARLVQGNLSAGTHQVQFNGRNLSSGIYYYRLQSGALVQTRKMLITK